MIIKHVFSLLIILFLFPAASFAQISDAPENAEAYLISPKDGETVSTTFTVRFGLKGMGVSPAGIEIEGTGHHHLLVNVEELPDLTTTLPTTDHVIHFGLGQTETELTLPPGEHTLQLVLGDFAHIPHTNPVISEKITILVKED